MKIQIEINFGGDDSPIRFATDTEKLLDDMNGQSRNRQPTAQTDANSKTKDRDPDRPVSV